MERMEKRFFKVLAIIIVLISYLLCMAIMWFVTMITILKILLSIIYAFLLLFAGIDFFHMINSIGKKVKNERKEEQIFLYHDYSCIRNFLICFSTAFFLLAYQCLLNFSIFCMIVVVILAIVCFAFSISMHIEAMKKVNSFNID